MAPDATVRPRFRVPPAGGAAVLLGLMAVLAGCGGGGSVPSTHDTAPAGTVPGVVSATPPPPGWAFAPFPVVQEAEQCATSNANGAPGVKNSQSPTAGNTLLGIAGWDPTIGPLTTGVRAGAVYTATPATSVVLHSAMQVYGRIANGSDGGTLSFYPSYSPSTLSGPGCGFMMELGGAHALDKWVAGSNNPPNGSQQVIPPTITPSAGAMVFACVMWETRSTGAFGSVADQSGANGWSQMLVSQFANLQDLMACEFMRQPADGTPVHPPVFQWSGLSQLGSGNPTLTFSIL